MGCDIHLFTERKRNINKTEKWVNIDNFKINLYSGNYELEECYQGRNYTLFSILADVRNYSDNKIISEPKGFPSDSSDIVRNKFEEWEGDGHSHSYLTMKEIYDFYEENKTVKYSGFVNKKGVDEIEKGKMPEWWCQGTNNEEMVYKEWELEDETLKDFINVLETHFISEYYNKEMDCENFRIVFWFDN